LPIRFIWPSASIKSVCEGAEKEGGLGLRMGITLVPGIEDEGSMRAFLYTSIPTTIGPLGTKTRYEHPRTITITIIVDSAKKRAFKANRSYVQLPHDRRHS
jgi:hypothetical protein